MPNRPGFKHFPAALDVTMQHRLLGRIREVLAEAPFYRPEMPRTGRPLSVRMSNCGPLGWLTDKAGGYRYVDRHPDTGRPWPAIPGELLEIWRRYGQWLTPPEACLVNHYDASARLGSHRDEDEENKVAPVVSISLGDDAVFHIGGLKRGDPKERLTLRSGDVVVLGGASRLAFHGIDRILPGTSVLLAEGGRLNLTLRRVSPD